MRNSRIWLRIAGIAGLLVILAAGIFFCLKTARFIGPYGGMMGGGRGMMRGFGGFGGFGAPWMVLGMLFKLVVPLLIIGLIVYFVAHRGDFARGSIQEDNAVNILRQRYAKGEINEEEFRRMRDELK